jgi:hypothetical protein
LDAALRRAEQDRLSHVDFLQVLIGDQAAARRERRGGR